MRSLITLLLVVALLAAACGDDDTTEAFDPGLFDTEIGDSYIDPSTPVISVEVDWLVVANEIGTQVPVPAGWATSRGPGGSGTYLLFGEVGDPRDEGHTDVQVLVEYDNTVFGEPALQSLEGFIGELGGRGD